MADSFKTRAQLEVNGKSYTYSSLPKLGEKFDKGIGVGNTARNWNTVLKLQELAKKAAG